MTKLTCVCFSFYLFRATLGVKNYNMDLHSDDDEKHGGEKNAGGYRSKQSKSGRGASGKADGGESMQSDDSSAYSLGSDKSQSESDEDDDEEEEDEG